MAKALTGIRVLDFARFGAGPITAMILGDMGAEVIRVEKPRGEEDRELPPFTPNGYSLLIMNFMRHKKCITLSLGSKKGQEIAKELVKRSDIVVHNFTPETREARWLDYSSLKKVNSKIIVVAVSAFGQYGPYAQRTAFDSVAQGMSGAMSVTGFPGNPPTRSAVPWVDFSTGQNAAIGALVALYYREKTGQGQAVDVSLLDSAVFVSDIVMAAEYKLYNIVRPQIGNQSYRNPTNSFKAKDGWLQIGAPVMVIWKRLTKAIGREDLADESRFPNVNTVYENRDLVNSIISEWIKDKKVAEVVDLMEKARVPCGPILSVDQVVIDPQIKARNMLVEVKYPGGTALQPGCPIKLSLTPGEAEGYAAAVGEHNEEIYCGLLGFSAEKLSQLQEEGVM